MVSVDFTTFSFSRTRSATPCSALKDAIVQRISTTHRGHSSTRRSVADCTTTLSGSKAGPTLASRYGCRKGLGSAEGRATWASADGTRAGWGEGRLTEDRRSEGCGGEGRGGEGG